MWLGGTRAREGRGDRVDMGAVGSRASKLVSLGTASEREGGERRASEGKVTKGEGGDGGRDEREEN